MKAGNIAYLLAFGLIIGFGVYSLKTSGMSFKSALKDRQ